MAAPRDSRLNASFARPVTPPASGTRSTVRSPDPPPSMTGLTLVKAMLIAAVIFTFLALVSTIRYRISENALEVLILGMVVRRILLADIEEVHRRGCLVHENWSGPKFWNSVTIRRKTGLFKNLVISPDDPDRFVGRLRESVARLSGGLSG